MSTAKKLRDRVTVETAQDDRSVTIRVALDGVQIGEIRPLVGWAPDLMEALDAGDLTMADFEQVAEAEDSIQGIERELRRRVAEKGPTP